MLTPESQLQTFLGFISRTETAITTYGATRVATLGVTRKTPVKKFEDGNGVWAGVETYSND
jgi:hypothetical protein